MEVELKAAAEGEIQPCTFTRITRQNPHPYLLVHSQLITPYYLRIHRVYSLRSGEILYGVRQAVQRLRRRDVLRREAELLHHVSDRQMGCCSGYSTEKGRDQNVHELRCGQVLIRWFGVRRLRRREVLARHGHSLV